MHGRLIKWNHYHLPNQVAPQSRWESFANLLEQDHVFLFELPATLDFVINIGSGIL